MTSKISIPYSDVLGADISNRILGNIHAIIDETFLYTGDEDYLHSRFLAFHGHHRSFYWSASQCIEKYCKANLLLLGVSVKGFGHDIAKLFQVLKEHDKYFKGFDFVMPTELTDIKDLWGSPKVGKFIDSVSEYGHADNRYDYVGISAEPSTVFKLDQLVYRLRKRITNKSIYEHTTLAPEMARYLYDNNFKFAPSDYSHSLIYDMNACFRLTTTSLELALKDCYGHDKIYKLWLEDNLQINTKSKKFKK
jgi:HEPN domain-containing protein